LSLYGDRIEFDQGIHDRWRYWEIRDESARLESPKRELVMPVAMPIGTDWLKSVLFDRGYLSRIKGEAIKVYLVVVEASGGVPDRSVTLSLSHLRARTQLSLPTVIESLVRLESLGLVVSTTHERGKIKTYYVADPPESPPEG
jgi:hypothetical protein